MGRRLVVRSLFLMLAASAGGIWGRQCPGCIDRARVNARCEWTGRETLVADAQLAEELAIQYADSEFNRQYGYYGHGGLEGSARNACMTRLLAAIEQSHGVSVAEMTRARAQRNPIFDTAAALSFVPIYVFGAAMAGALLRRRFSGDQHAVKSIAAVLMSVAGSFLGLQVGQLWLGVWETIRVRNGHISVFRFASRAIWTHSYAWPLVLCGIAICWLVARSERLTAVRRLSRGASMATGTFLAAAFAEVFAAHILGYTLVAAALALFLSVVSVEPLSDPAPSSALLR